jgi:hypothetical protein
MMPIVKHYKTEPDDKTDRFAMLSELLAEDCAKMGGRTPRVLHLSDQVYHEKNILQPSYYYLQCIVVWEQQYAQPADNSKA